MKNIFSKAKSELKNQKENKFFYELASKYLKDARRVLDVGCGLGNFVKLNLDNTIGLDWNNENLLSLKQELPLSNLIRGDALRLPFNNNTFDAIHCAHLIEHFQPNDAYLLLEEMDRILVIGGKIIISTPLLWDGFYNDLTHVRPYNPTSILHYYTSMKHSRTKQKMNCDYEVIDLKYRYYETRLKPIVHTIRILSISSILVTKLLNFLGFRKLAKNGYLMVLKKMK